MYNTFVAYVLWLFSGCGALGFHRFYLGKIPTGFLWMCTGGLCMVGSVYDFFTLPDQVRKANIRKALYEREIREIYSSEPRIGKPDNWRYASDARHRVMNGNKDSIEHVILKLAKENKGILTISDVALGAHMSIEEAKKYLDVLASKGFAELRVRKSGSLVYVIPDMADKDEPLEDF